MTRAVIVDFDVNSELHYAALQDAVNADESVSLVDVGQALDQALGNGPVLAALVQKYDPQFKAYIFELDGDII